MTLPITTQPVLQRYEQLRRRPFGKALFSWLLCCRAPYFRTIRPRVLYLRPGRCVVAMSKRRAVYNHIQTVHALAIGNLCELAAGLMMEVTVPPTLRWLPKGMMIEYLHRAETDLVATCELPPAVAFQAATEVPVTVRVRDGQNQEVVTAVIRMWLSARQDVQSISPASPAEDPTSRVSA
ncbi:MAG: hotdog fold domain-containing protein [Candidatus Competibacteraceae bacterium]